MRNAVRTIIGSIFAIAMAREGVACSCVQTPTPAEAFGAASSVTVVRITRVRDRLWIGKRLWYSIFEPDFSDYSDFVRRFGYEVIAELETSFKGKVSRNVRLVTGRGGGDCGFPFREGARYLLYLAPVGDQLPVVTICGRSRAIEEAQDDMAFLSGRHTMGIDRERPSMRQRS